MKTLVWALTGWLAAVAVSSALAAKEPAITYDGRPGPYLVVFIGGDHMIFSGRPRRSENLVVPGWYGSARKGPMFQDLIRSATTAFWDAYLKDAKPAKAFLTTGGLQKLLGTEGMLETKTKTP